jgi:transcriptional regulator with XRE-family HTH domain
MLKGVRRSPLKHTVAVLRSAIGPDMTQKELAGLLNYSPVTIQKIELGQLRLTESLAAEIVRHTGVDLHWLLANDVDKPIIDHFNQKPYTRKWFEAAQAMLNRKLGQHPNDRGRAYHNVWRAVARYARLAESGLRKGKFDLLDYKLGKMFEQLEAEFKPGSIFPKGAMGFSIAEAPERFTYAAQAALKELFGVIDATVKTPSQSASSQSSPPARHRRAKR